MWKANVSEIDVPECDVELSDKGLLVLHIQIDFPELDKLKVLPSSGDNTFAVEAKTDLVSLSCKACWLISFELYSHIRRYDSGEACVQVARLVFAFKCTDKDDLRRLIRSQEEAPLQPLPELLH